LHLCCTTNQHFTTTNLFVCDQATIQASTRLSQINSIVTSLRDRKRQGPLSCHLAEAELSELPSMQRERWTSSSMQSVQIRPRHMQALHNVLLVFLILSSHASTSIDTPVTPSSDLKCCSILWQSVPKVLRVKRKFRKLGILWGFKYLYVPVCLRPCTVI